jgi:hypothetical protein
MKLFIDAIPSWKMVLQAEVSLRDSILQSLILIYFHYYFNRNNEAVEKTEEVSGPRTEKRANASILSSLIEIEKQPFEICKKMKNLIIR